MPVRYEDRSRLTSVKSLSSGTPAAVRARVEKCEVRSAKFRNLHIALLEINDGSGPAKVTIFGGRMSFTSLAAGKSMLLYGAPLEDRGCMEFKNPDWTLLADDEADKKAKNDWFRILPVYPTVKQLPRKQLAGIIYRCVTSPDFRVSDTLPDEILKKRSFPSLADAFRGVHAPRSDEEIRVSRSRLAYQEFYDVQKKIFESVDARKKKRAFSLKNGLDLARKFTLSLPFEMTDSQSGASEEISRDLCRESPMHRLLQGDVGAGKTVVAARAIAQCLGAGRQAAVMAPTTVLTGQFYRECVKLLSPLGIKCVEFLGGMPACEREKMLESLRTGEAGLVVGAHALLGDGLEFKSLGLVVIDEQHRFGVLQRERLAKRDVMPHTLMMSATPIPRTLCMAVYGDMDATVMTGRPPGRMPVITKIVSDNHTDEVYSFLERRIKRGERCYWVCPSIGDEPAAGDGQNVNAPGLPSIQQRVSDMEEKIKKIRVERLHGKLTRDEKNEAISRFARGESDVLVATTVIEVGLDVPEATVIVIESACRFGLAQLHQLRGRVGRGGRQGFCLLLDSALNIKNHGRLHVLKKTDDGFVIAEEDMKERGAGEIAGVRQHGEISFRAANPAMDAGLLLMAREDVYLTII
jgi:ATP-dependent DNA helicase RecG